MSEGFSRRTFLTAALAAGAAAAVPVGLEPFLDTARAAPPTPAPGAGGFYFTAAEWATCAALCNLIVPTGADPKTQPGAAEARAVVFIDRFLSAFELPPSVADNPAIYLKGQYSGRNPFPNVATGEPSTRLPADAFLTGNTAHFVGLTPRQQVSWRVQLYGPDALKSAPVSAKWKTQVGNLIPAGPGLRIQYREGLAAFDTYSHSLFGTPFAHASQLDQELMFGIAGNLILANLPLPVPSPPAAPSAAQALLSVMTVHTFQACYGLPEYAWHNQTDDPDIAPLQATPNWRALNYPGDTEPLGNTIYDESLYGAGQGPNAGFGDPDVYVPFGGYREFRPTSTLDPDAALVSADQLKPLTDALAKRGVKVHTPSRPASRPAGPTGDGRA